MNQDIHALIELCRVFKMASVNIHIHYKCLVCIFPADSERMYLFIVHKLHVPSFLYPS